MRKIIVLTCLFVGMNIGLMAAHADVYSDAVGAGSLVHQYYYTWGLNWTVPSGESITKASLTFEELNDWTTEPNDVIYLHLLDNPQLGWRSYWDNQGGGDNFAGQGLFLDKYEDKNGNTPETWVYEFSPLAKQTLGTYAANNGVFGFGIDPDCQYNHEGISVMIETAPVPAPGGVLLGVIGLGMVGWIRRRFA